MTVSYKEMKSNKRLIDILAMPVEAKEKPEED